MLAADDKIAASKRGLYDKLSQGLAPMKKAKLYAFLQEFESDLRRMADEVRGHRGGQHQDHGRDGGPEGGPPDGDRRGPGPDASVLAGTVTVPVTARHAR